MATEPSDETVAVQMIAGQPLATILISNYNYGRFVGKAIDSALAQTYPAVEILVVDDGSTDDSAIRLADYGERIRVITQEHSGFVSAIETGVAAANGDYLCLLDADDEFEPQKVELVVALFENDKSLTQVSNGRLSIDAEGHRLLTRHRTFNTGDVVELLRKYGRYGCAITSGLSYPAAVIRSAFPIDTHHEINTVDTYLTIHAAVLGPVGAIDEPLTRYRIHGDNMQVGQTDVDFLERQRLAALAYIDAELAAKDLARPIFDAATDPELTCLAVLAGERVPMRRRLHAAMGSVVEAVGSRVQPVDAAATLFSRVVMLTSATEGARIHALGPGDYVRVRLLRRPARTSAHRTIDDG